MSSRETLQHLLSVEITRALGSGMYLETGADSGSLSEELADTCVHWSVLELGRHDVVLHVLQNRSLILFHPLLTQTPTHASH